MRGKKRMVHWKISTSEKFGAISFEAECLYNRLLTMTDDYGNVPGGVGTIKDSCFPKKHKSIHRNNDVTYQDVENWMSELLGTGLVIEYFNDGIQYVHFSRFEEFQKLRADRMVKEYPDFEAATKPQPTGYQLVTNPQPDGDQVPARAAAPAAGEVRSIKLEEKIQKKPQAAKKENQSDVPPDAAAAFPEKLESRAVVATVVDDPGGYLTDKYRNTHTGKPMCRRDCLDIAKSVVWCRVESGQKIKNPVGLMKFLARQYQMDPEEFASGMEELIENRGRLEELQRKAERAAEKARKQAEMDKEEDRRIAERKDKVRLINGLPRDKFEEITNAAIARFNAEFPHVPPTSHDPTFQEILVSEYEKTVTHAT